MSELQMHDVDRWLDAICELDADALRRVGRCYVRSCDASLILQAQRKLATALARNGAEVDVWMLRDQVETICHVAAAAGGDARSAARRELLAARVAAEWATLAVAFADHITAAEAMTLCSPFAEVLPRLALRLV